MKFILVSTIAVTACAFYFLYKKNKYNKHLYPTIDIELLDTKDVIKWLKSDGREEKIKSSTNIIPLVISKPNEKFNLPDGYYLACIFDNVSNEIIDGVMFNPENVSKNFSELFKNKSMVVLN